MDRVEGFASPPPWSNHFPFRGEDLFSKGQREKAGCLNEQSFWGKDDKKANDGKETTRLPPFQEGLCLDPRIVSSSINFHSSGAFRELGGTLSSEPRCLTPPSKNCTRNRLSEIGSGLRGNVSSLETSISAPSLSSPLFLSRVFPLSSWMPPPSGLQQQQQKPLPPTPFSPSSHRPNLSLDTSTNETAEGPFSPPSVVLDTPSSFGTPYMDSEDSPEGDYSSRRNGEGSSGAGGGSLQVGLEVEPPLGAVSPSPSSPSLPFLFPITMERRGLKGREDASEWNPAMQSVVEEPFGLWEVRLTG